jgi:hypothetical protein
LILKGRFLRLYDDLRADFIGLNNLEVVSIDQVLDDNVICQLNQMLVGIIEVDLEEVIVVLNEDPVIVPLTDGELILERFLGCIYEQQFFFNKLPGNIADLDIDQLRESYSDGTLGSVIGDVLIYNEDRSEAFFIFTDKDTVFSNDTFA